MAIIQEAFEISDDLMIKILTGECKRIGGVVRYAVGPNKGQIVKHLEPVNPKAVQQAKGLLAKGMELVKHHKKGFVIGATVTILVTAGGAIYIGIKNKEPKTVKRFRRALGEYITAIRNGELTEELIDELEISLEEMKKSKNFEKFKLKLTSEEIGVLVSKIFDYTEQLAKNNNFDMEDLAATNNKSVDDVIVNLENYLKKQKKWFQVA